MSAIAKIHWIENGKEKERLIYKLSALKSMINKLDSNKRVYWVMYLSVEAPIITSRNAVLRRNMFETTKSSSDAG